MFGRRILYNSAPMPPDISREVVDLLLKLLQKDPKVRLGAKGAQEIKAHPFFKVINNAIYMYYCIILIDYFNLFIKYLSIYLFNVHFNMAHPVYVNP